MGKQLIYLKIVDSLRRKIIQGDYPPGTLLPSNKDLAALFATSVMTVRQALSVLEEEAMISIVHGTGTFVSSEKVHGPDISLQGFQNEISIQVKTLSTKVLKREYHQKVPGLDSLFGTPGMTFSCLSRLRLLEGIPVIFQKSYVSDAYAEVFREYRENTSLYQYFSERTGSIINKGREIVTPALLDGEVLDHLQLDSPCAAFQSKRVSITIKGEAVLFDEAFLPRPYTVITSSKQGKLNKFRYIINLDGGTDNAVNLMDREIWEDE